MNSKIILLFCLALFLSESKAQNLYFPPFSSAATWDTLAPASLGWCQDRIDTFYNFLGQENTKAFLVLKDGKIVLEKYFSTFTKDSIWYWASAGKTITSFLVGKAQEEGYLSIQDTTSKYLGAGWTNCTIPQEDNIKIVNQLTMTTGLDDGVADNHCTVDSCLLYLADPGTRWAYHNAPYTLLEGVLTNATGTNINAYTTSRLKNATGMTGLWFTVDFDNIFFSTARSMARYGLLIQNNCIWNTDTLLFDTTYIQQMTNTSQALNYSYGYLWWLNGKQSYMVPTLQTIFPGSYAPQAPIDMFSGLGKNGQIVSISPSEGLVFVRMGDSPNSPASEVTTLFCNQIWEKINDLSCSTSSDNTLGNLISGTIVYPNPTNGSFQIELRNEKFSIQIFDTKGKTVYQKNDLFNKTTINHGILMDGIYTIRLNALNGRSYYSKLIISN